MSGFSGAEWPNLKLVFCSSGQAADAAGCCYVCGDSNVVPFWACAGIYVEISCKTRDTKKGTTLEGSGRIILRRP